MTGRRRLLAGLVLAGPMLAGPMLAVLCASPALAQGTAEGQRPKVAEPKPARSVVRRRPPAAPAPSLAPALANPWGVPPPAQHPAAPSLSSPAPVPDRNQEWGQVLPQPTPSFSPSLIQRPLPGRGQVPTGSFNELEDKLFRPAPGARLSLPFTYD